MLRVLRYRAVLQHRRRTNRRRPLRQMRKRTASHRRQCRQQPRCNRRRRSHGQHPRSRAQHPWSSHTQHPRRNRTEILWRALSSRQCRPASRQRPQACRPGRPGRQFSRGARRPPRRHLLQPRARRHQPRRELEERAQPNRWGRRLARVPQRRRASRQPRLEPASSRRIHSKRGRQGVRRTSLRRPAQHDRVGRRTSLRRPA